MDDQLRMFWKRAHFIQVTVDVPVIGVTLSKLELYSPAGVDLLMCVETGFGQAAKLLGVAHVLRFKDGKQQRRVRRESR